MYRLPDPWSKPEVVSDVIVADEVAIHRAGVSTSSAGGEEICGAAAATGAPAIERAWFELLERVSGVEAIDRRAESYDVKTPRGEVVARWARRDVFPESDAPDHWRYSRSNGLAIHVDFATASERARLELAERDRIVRSWHGEVAPKRIDLPTTPLLAAKSYEWRAYSFPEHTSEGFSADVDVVGVFGFPVVPEVPFVLGFAGRLSEEAAATGAAAEALQLMAFLWGEPIPTRESIPAAPTAARHLDTYQVAGGHAVVRRWLEGAHVAFGRTSRVGGCTVAEPIQFVDITPTWLARGLCVVKAVCRQAIPLIFGHSPMSANLPPELRLHPIP